MDVKPGSPPRIGRMDVLATERLRLVPWREEFREDVARLTADPRVYRTLGLGTRWTPEYVDERHRAYLEHWRSHGFGWRGVLAADGGEFLGIAALNYAGTRVPGVDGSAFEIGWWLDPAYQGRGIATEAARATRDDAFGRLGAPRLAARVRIENTASARVAARVGMRLRGEAVAARGEAIKVFTLDRRAWPGPGRATA